MANSIIPDCFSGSRPACEQLIFWAYLWPGIRRGLELPPRIIPEPTGPDWDPFALDSIIAIASVGPKPEPAIRLDAMIKLHGKLAKMTKKLEAEIKELQRAKNS